jgi:hypothetical protein
MPGIGDADTPMNVDFSRKLLGDWKGTDPKNSTIVYTYHFGPDFIERESNFEGIFKQKRQKIKYSGGVNGRGMVQVEASDGNEQLEIQIVRENEILVNQVTFRKWNEIQEAMQAQS